MAHLSNQVVPRPVESHSIQARFVLLTLAIYALQLMSGNRVLVGLSHWLIPDGLTYHEVMRALADYGFDAIGGILPEQFAGVPVNPALFLYYYPFSILFGSAGYFIANQMLVLSIGDRSLLLGIILTPYFLLSFPLPSKDLLVLTLFLPLTHILTRRQFVWAALLASLIFLVRDGAGVIAFASLIAVMFAPSRPRYRLYLLASAAIGIMVLNHWVYDNFGETFILSRNLQIAQDEGNFDVSGEGAGSYLVRLFGNATNLGFRPVLFDLGGNVPILSIAYWISGISQIVCSLFAVRYLYSDSTDGRSSLVSMLFLTSLLIISLNPLVQPRYQLFFVVIMLDQVIKTESVSAIARAYLCTSIFALIAIAGYLISGIGLPPSYGWAQPTDLI